MPKSKTKRKKTRSLEFSLPKSVLKKEAAGSEQAKKPIFKLLKKRPGYGPILSQLVFEEYASGESTGSIAKKYGIGRSTVKDLLYEEERGSLIGHPLPSEKGEHISRAKKLKFKRMSEEEREKYSQMMSDAAKALWEGMNEKEKKDFLERKTEAINKSVQSLTKEERKERYGTEWDRTRLDYMSKLGKNWFKRLPAGKQEELKIIFAAMKNFQLKTGEAKLLMERFWEGMDPTLKKWKKIN